MDLFLFLLAEQVKTGYNRVAYIFLVFLSLWICTDEAPRKMNINRVGEAVNT